MNFRLLYEVDGRQEEYVIDGPETLIGRGSDNQLVLTDYGISRTHCRLVWDGTDLSVVDMGSRNGTKVNGKLADRALLADGDELVLGRFLLRVEAGAKSASDKTTDFVLEEKPLLDAPGTIIKPMTTSIDEHLTSFSDQPLAVERDVEAGKRGNILVTLTQVAKTLISADSLDEILDKVMDLTFEHLPAERGFLMLWDEKEGRLLPHVIKTSEKGESETLAISKTITQKVYDEQVSILTTDASIDPRFSGAESIIFQGIRSAMCVPLWNEGEVVGVVGVDSLMAKHRFEDSDLDLLTALANYAAVAIQRARLHERVREESEARAKLSRYHSPGVVTKILASGNVDSDWNIDVQEREVSILFSDIVGFTPISERLKASEAAMLLNYYFSEMTSIIFEHEGTLDKFIGDAIMAVFGAPIAQKNHAERAVEAALAMIQRVGELDFKEELGLDVDIRVRIGVNSGTVVAGDIGSPQRMEYTVIGDTVNAASRLEEDVASPGEVVIGEATYKPIKSKFKFDKIGSLDIRGRKGTIRCFKVLSKN